MKRQVLLLILVGLLFEVTVQQLSLHLEYNRIDQSATQARSRHHLQSASKVVEHKKISRLSHNVDFIRNHIKTNRHFSELSHQLRTASDGQHLRLQTFNLVPSQYAFSLPMKIGGIKYKMSIDSGSSDIFIKGEKAAGKPKQRYHCGQVCIDTHDHYGIGYLDGKLQTYQTKLEVQIGQHKFNESILVAYKVEHNFEQNEGLVGLSFPGLASNPNPTFLQTLKNQKIIDSYAFGVNLNFQDKSRSFITCGSFDNKFFEGQLDYFPLTSNKFYYIKSQGVSIGDSSLLKINAALFDTGNTCISIPNKYQSDILKQFNKASGKNGNLCFFDIEDHAQMFSVLRCRVNDFDALPVLKIHLGEKVYSIEKEFYLQACDRRPKDQKSHLKDNEGTWYCDTYIETVSGMSELFLGDGFFNRYYTYFNLDTKQLAIAKNKEVITVERIKQNQLDADKDDWENVLKSLNQSESRQDIRKQIQESSLEEQQTSDDQSQQ